MKKSKLTLAELKVKSFTILTDSTDKQTIAGGAKDTTPDDTPHTVPDKPIDLHLIFKPSSRTKQPILKPNFIEKIGGDSHLSQ